jgi:hypothetical protein
LSILSAGKQPANPRIRSTDGGSSAAPHSPGSDPTPESPCAPFLEQRSSADGLVQLLPRNYAVRNRERVNVRKDATGDSVMTTPESPPATDEGVAHVESREILKASGGFHRGRVTSTYPLPLSVTFGSADRRRRARFHCCRTQVDQHQWRSRLVYTFLSWMTIG